MQRRRGRAAWTPPFRKRLVAAHYRDVNVLLPDVHWGLCRCALLVLFFYAAIPFLALCVIALLSFCVDALCPTPAAIFSSSFCTYLKGGFYGFSFLYDDRCSVVLVMLSTSSSSSSYLLVLLSPPFLLVHLILLILLFLC